MRPSLIQRLRNQTIPDSQGHWFMRKSSTQMSIEGRIVTIRHAAYYIAHNKMPPKNALVFCRQEVKGCVRPSHMVYMESMRGLGWTQRQINRVRQRALRMWYRRCRACGRRVSNRFWAKRLSEQASRKVVWCLSCYRNYINVWESAALKDGEEFPRVIFWELIPNEDALWFENAMIELPTRTDCLRLAINQERSRISTEAGERKQVKIGRFALLTNPEPDEADLPWPD